MPSLRTGWKVKGVEYALQQMPVDERRRAREMYNEMYRTRRADEEDTV